MHAEPKALAPVVDYSSYPSGSTNQANAPTSNALYEIFGRLEQMQMELQELRGLVEEQSNEIQTLKERQENMYSDLDGRLVELTNPKNTDEELLDQESMLNEQDQQNLVESSNETNPVPNQTDVVESQSTPQQPDGLNEKQMYKAAYETLRNGHNKRAIREFETLLKRFPEGQFASNSQYWLGEAHKVNRNIQAAKKAFNEVVNNYPNSNKVPDALLKLGYIELEQNNKASARDYLTQITVNHPDSTAAHLAKKKLLQMETLNR